MGRGHWANERDSEGAHGRDRSQHGVGTIYTSGQKTMCRANSARATDNERCGPRKFVKMDVMSKILQRYGATKN